jgi:glycerol-3-phosphate acyltransferase PlsY
VFFSLDIWKFFPLLVLASYFFGSLNFSIIFSKAINKNDIRNLGSKNAGFSNVLRSIGVLPAVLTFVGDFAKSIFVIYFGKLILERLEISAKEMPAALYILGLFCFLGHVYPCFFGFKGGKGILAGWAMNLLIDWRVFAASILIFLIVLFVFKMISLASIVSAVCYPIFVFTSAFFYGSDFALHILGIVSILSLITIFKHKSNFKRIISGTESKVDVRKKQTL